MRRRLPPVLDYRSPDAMPTEPRPKLTSEERFAEIAALLRKGFDRCPRSRRRDATSNGRDSSESSADGLEVPAETRLSGSRRIGG